MHIPDGFLDLPIIITLSVVSAGTIFYASKKTDKYIGEKRIPLMGIMAAFIFAVQMLNIPIPGGTSGHITGALLVAILLGPFTGFLVISTVL
ncbi:energy-coupling factor ABC transporter permease, partial [bacterium]|nr:energy-coupling factor ABC transporter permease [bacterium]